MKTLIQTISMVLLMGMSWACSENEYCCIPEYESQMVGSWLLYERGYSPGSGYITVAVETDPPQTMELKDDGKFASNINGLEDYRYYLIVKDRDWDVLALFESRTDPGDLDMDRLEHSYNMELREDGTVKLFFRFCIEGCHLGLRPITKQD